MGTKIGRTVPVDRVDLSRARLRIQSLGGTVRAGALAEILDMLVIAEPEPEATTGGNRVEVAEVTGYDPETNTLAVRVTVDGLDHGFIAVPIPDRLYIAEQDAFGTLVLAVQP